MPRSSSWTRTPSVCNINSPSAPLSPCLAVLRHNPPRPLLPPQAEVDARFPASASGSQARWFYSNLINYAKRPPHTGGLLRGSSSWTRTNDPAVNSRMLYQLSYRGIFGTFLLYQISNICQALFFEILKLILSCHISVTLLSIGATFFNLYCMPSSLYLFTPRV